MKPLYARSIYKLDQISDLKDNWNLNGAQAFSPELIERCKDILKGLIKEPLFIVPTAAGCIQFEYIITSRRILPDLRWMLFPVLGRPTRSRYLEFEIFPDLIKSEKFISRRAVFNESGKILHTVEEMNVEIQHFYSDDNDEKLPSYGEKNALKRLIENSTFGVGVVKRTSSPLESDPKLDVIQRIKEIGFYTDNWDQEGAPAFDPKVIENALNIVSRLDIIPREIFPNVMGSIDLAYYSVRPFSIDGLNFSILEDKIIVTASGELGQSILNKFEYQSEEPYIVPSVEVLNSMSYEFKKADLAKFSNLQS